MKKDNLYNVLVVGCHPDDAELGCGGTIVKHIQRGDSVSVLILTRGEKGNHDPTLGECKRALKTLGVKRVIFGNFPDGYVASNQEVVNFIENVMKELNIDRVYTHDMNDRHQDHRNCGLAVSAAARKLKEVFLFHGPSTNVKFEPHYFIEISDKHLKKKLKALNCYRSQVKKGIVDLNFIKSAAVFYGIHSGTKYAEAFSLNHFVQGGQNV